MAMVRAMVSASLGVFLQVHAFNVMMRLVRKGHVMEDHKVSSTDLQDYLPQYQAALDQLRKHV